MQSSERVDVLIVGAGPAGTSAALNLIRKSASWARRIVVIERAVHPRKKLCGGAVTHLGERVLARMGLALADVPHVAVREVRVVHRGHACSFRGDPVMRVVRRDELDHFLVRKAESAGAEIRQGEAVTGLRRQGDHVDVTTSRATFQARVVVAADGSRSTVRKLLGLRDPEHLARLLEVLTPVEPLARPLVDDGVAVFDFGELGAGLGGYYWDFPSLVGGAPAMNRGVYECRVGGKELRLPLARGLAKALADRGHDLEALELEGHPIRTFNPAGPLSLPHVLLAGDAAGVDPLWGEGISFALAYGEVVAEAVAHAFATGRFDFATYAARVRAHPLLGQLAMRVRLAKLVQRLAPRQVDRVFGAAKAVVRFSRWSDPAYVPAQGRHWLFDA